MDTQAAGPDAWQMLHQGRLTALIELGQIAADLTLQYFRNADLAVDRKADDSPVTIADREAERLFRDRILKRYPEDTVMGEEHGEQVGTSGFRWVIDPIDGTKSFIGGVPMYSTLVALEVQDEAYAGAIFIPALGELAVACRDHGCWYRPNATAEFTRANVSSRGQIADAIFVTTAVASFYEVDAGRAFEALQEQSWFTRTWGDGYGYLLVATGRADFMVDPIVSPWDIAAIAPVIDEAGGRFSDWQGSPTTRGTNAVGTNGHLHNDVLTLLQR